MITINNKYRIPSTWYELNEKQYISIISLINRFEKREIDFNRFKIEIVFILINNVIVAPGNNILCDNIYRLSEKLNFAYKFRYNDSRYDNLSGVTQEWLKKNIPSADDEDPELKIASVFDYSVDIDLMFAKQQINKIDGKQGYEFTYLSGIANTSLTALQYINANSILDLYFTPGTNKDDLLNSLCELLYPGAKNVNSNIKQAVLYNYIAILNWISRLTKYDIVFNGSKSNSSKKSIIGTKNLIYTLSEKGYGTLAEVSDMPLFDFLDLLLKNTIDSVHQLNAYEVKRDEIASKLNLTIQQVNYILL